MKLHTYGFSISRFPGPLFILKAHSINLTSSKHFDRVVKVSQSTRPAPTHFFNEYVCLCIIFPAVLFSIICRRLYVFFFPFKWKIHARGSQSVNAQQIRAPHFLYIFCVYLTDGVTRMYVSTSCVL